MKHKNIILSMSTTRRLGFFLIGVACFFLLVEVMSFAFCEFFRKDFFSREADYFAQVDRAAFERWLGSPWYDEKLGWNVPTRPTTTTAKECHKKMLSYFNQDEHRGTPRPGVPALALFGDSFTYGIEAAENETTAAALERIIDAPVLNYGIPAGSPVQAVLKFERLAETRQLPKVAVLVIMHENIRRVVNSFRPALYFNTPEIGLWMRPYVDGDQVIEAPRIKDYDEFVTEAKRRFKQDFWARPRLSFPYTISLYQALTGNTFFYNNAASWGMPATSYDYKTDNSLRVALTAIIDRWRSSVSAKGIMPYVLFVPYGAGDRGVSAEYAERLNANAGQTFAFEFDDPAMDWERYNLNPERGCHPTPYGYERIAEFIASHIVKSTLQTSTK